MKRFLILTTILCAIICAQGAIQGLGQRIECFRNREVYETRIYEARIRELVEGLRDQLKAGIPEKNIPPLDPFVMDNWNLHVKEEFARLNWNMTGNIAGLMSWELTDIKFNIAGFKFNFQIAFKQIPGKGSYSIDGTILELLPVYGSGEFDVLADNLVITGSGKLGSVGSGENQHLFLENFEISTSLDKFVFGVTGLMDDQQLSFLLSQMISDSLPDLIKNFDSQINAVVSAKITQLADSVLTNMTMQDILDLLKPKPSEYLAYIIHCGDY